MPVQATVYGKAKDDEINAKQVNGASVDLAGHLILSHADGTTSDAGDVRGRPGVALVEDTSDPGTFLYGAGLTPDSTDPGTFLIGA